MYLTDYLYSDDDNDSEIPLIEVELSDEQLTEFNRLRQYVGLNARIEGYLTYLRMKEMIDFIQGCIEEKPDSFRCANCTYHRGCVVQTSVWVKAPKGREPGKAGGKKK